MISLVYVSSATRPFSEQELLGMLNTFRAHNAEAQITGMMLYKNASFMQALEGPEEAVETLFASIQRDRRHFNVLQLTKKQIAQRSFPDWSMAFQNISGLNPDQVPGYSEFLEEPLDSDGFRFDPSRARRLLDIFRRTWTI